MWSKRRKGGSPYYYGLDLSRAEKARDVFRLAKATGLGKATIRRIVSGRTRQHCRVQETVEGLCPYTGAEIREFHLTHIVGPCGTVDVTTAYYW